MKKCTMTASGEVLKSRQILQCLFKAFDCSSANAIPSIYSNFSPSPSKHTSHQAPRNTRSHMHKYK